jgi:hypothetical protein
MTISLSLLSYHYQHNHNQNKYHKLMIDSDPQNK